MKKILLLFALGVFSMALHAQNGPKISVQGKLNDVDGLPLADGDQELIFRLYHQPTGGTAIWADTAMVEIRGGIYSYNLGSGNPLIPAQFDAAVYVGVVVDGVEIAPRTELTYAPYTLGTNFATQTDTVVFAHSSPSSPTDSLEVLEGLRILRGGYGNSSVEGFTRTPVNNSPHYWDITFNEPFSGVPTVIVHAINTGGSNGGCLNGTISWVSSTGLRVHMWDCFNGTWSWRNFKITIIGPK